MSWICLKSCQLQFGSKLVDYIGGESISDEDVGLINRQSLCSLLQGNYISFVGEYPKKLAAALDSGGFSTKKSKK